MSEKREKNFDLFMLNHLAKRNKAYLIKNLSFYCRSKLRLQYCICKIIHDSFRLISGFTLQFLS